MKRMSLFLAVLSIFFVTRFSPGAQTDHSVYQVNTITSLKHGLYDGGISFGRLKEFGDFGLGTLDRLDGEMVALDGHFYQVKTNGKTYEINESAQTPFAVVTFFKPEKKILLKRADSLKSIQRVLDDLLPSKGLPYAIRIDGKFPFIKARSVPAQTRPYPDLESALKQQVVFELKNIRATLVGFRFPEYMQGVNVAGYHFHFVDRERKTGGHVLDCSAEDLQIAFSSLRDFHMTLTSGLIQTK
jgi:acetolactate decarboxylase